MSIEEKANAYDNALNKAKQLLSKCKRVSDKASMIYRAEDIESMFPELKESDNERIRKELIKLLRNLFNNYSYFIKDPFYTECIAWLEKQSEMNIQNNNPLKIEPDKFYFCIKDYFAGGCYRSKKGDIVLAKNGMNMMGLSPKEASEYFMPTNPFNEDVVVWLEKQGEQKSVEDSLTLEEFENAFITKAKQYDIDLPNRSWDIYALCKELYSLKHKPKQSEQKPFDYENANIQQKDFAPKVEPKFKVGDWITDGNITIQIEAIKNNCYSYCGDCTLYSIKTADKVYHLWTIEDAKDGDILITENNEKPFIFKGLDIRHPNKPIAYGGVVDSGYFMPSNKCTNRWTDGNACPATKEQCDLLFRKIKEAGFKWNKNKKELKRI
jgi:hypothetical protein